MQSFSFSFQVLEVILLYAKEVQGMTMLKIQVAYHKVSDQLFQTAKVLISLHEQ